MKKKQTIDPLQWTIKKQKNLNRSIKKNIIGYNILAAINILMQITIITLSVVALQILLASEAIKSRDFAVIMSSLSAGVIVLIFIMNIVFIIYKEKMKWDAYKKISNFIQAEFMRYKYDTKFAKKVSATNKVKKLETNILNFIEKTLPKRKTIKTKSIFIKALAGGHDEN